MAILQISRITQRKGLAQDLPQPLASAELGWVIDERKLYIGNGDLAEGAPVVGNTEILTEYSDLLSYSTAYTYKGEAAGYTVQTGPTSGSPVSQSLQNRLDSYAIVTDFGAVGDGVTDDTDAINRALFQLYCRQTNAQSRRSLFFPGGTYLVTNTINVPTYATLVGEGINSSIIKFQINSWVSLTAYSAGVLVRYDVNGLYYRSLSPVPAEDPNNPGVAIAPTDTNYWQNEPLPEFVAQTADSLCQTQTDIGTNGATPPTGISISNMQFQTMNTGSISGSHDIWLVNRAVQVSFTNVAFVGPFTIADGSTSAQDLSCVRFESSTSLVSNNISFNSCQFLSATYAINTDQDLKCATIANSMFDILYQGVVLGENTLAGTSPCGVRITNSIFNRIYYEAISIAGAEFNVSSNNIFYDVGNAFINFITTPVINIDGDNNFSIGDTFERTTAESATQPRIDLNGTGSVALSMNIKGIDFAITDNTISNQLELGAYTRTTGVTDVLVDNSTNDLFVIDTSLASPIVSFKVDYSIVRSSTFRTGTMTVVSGAGFSFVDDYSENAATGITLLASQTGSNVTVAYTATSTGDSGTIRYSITHLS